MGAAFARIEAVPVKMAETQKETQLKMREMQMAMQLAQARDTLKFFSAFTATVATLGTINLIKTKRPTGLIPLVPLSFVTAYQYDFAYGTKIERIRAEAERILEQEHTQPEKRFAPPSNNLLVETGRYNDIFTSKD